MPTFPFNLKPNYVSIYGASSIQGINPINPQMQFGLVEQISGALPNVVAVGDSVMFRVDDANVVEYNGNQYFLVQEQNIILTEDSAAPWLK